MSKLDITPKAYIISYSVKGLKDFDRVDIYSEGAKAPTYSFFKEEKEIYKYTHSNLPENLGKFLELIQSERVEGEWV